jgi:hypothetical protein
MTDQAEAIQRIRELAAVNGATVHRSRLPATPGTIELSVQLGAVNLAATIGDDRAWGRFKSSRPVTWGQDVKDVDSTAEGPIGTWLLWVSIGISLAAGRTTEGNA